jgi:subtilisin family serine protease
VKGLICLVALGLLVGCQSDPPLRASATLPAMARESPQHFVVLTVHNPVNLSGARAASSPRGYDGVGPYMAGAEAQAVSRALMRDYHLRESASWPIALLGVNCLVYEMPSDADSSELLARLSRDARVESVQPLLNFETAARPYNDPYAHLQHNMEQLGVAAAHALSRGGGVRIAVIDTGVQVNHPDLPTTLVSRNFVDNDSGAFSADAHGTAVAGIIGAVPDNGVGIIGIAPDASLLVYKACWRAAASGVRAVCNTFTLAQAIAAAIEARADIINLSLDGPSDPLLSRLIRRALHEGIIVVGAIPPDGLRDAFPTDIDNVIAVDAIENNFATADVIRAPGRDVLSLAPQSHYDFYSGSSLATAEISGVIALLRAKQTHLTAHEAQMLLIAEAPAVPDACAALGAMLHHAQRCE